MCFFTYNPSRNQYTHFLCFQNELPARERSVTRKATPALHKYFTGIISQYAIVLGNKAHETVASWNYTLLGYTPEISWGN